MRVLSDLEDPALAGHSAVEKSNSSTHGPGRSSFHIAQLYMRMAEGIREGKSVSPEFDVAVERHRLLDAIQKASDTGIRQIL
jgi:predicted dehydrogenase